MKCQQKTVLLLCTLALGSSTLFTSAIEAKKPDKVKPAETSVNTTTTTTTSTSTQLLSLTALQRTQIVEIIRGTSTYSYLINTGLRQQIFTQVSSLPPGIKKNLARGKGLHPMVKVYILESPRKSYFRQLL